MTSTDQIDRPRCVLVLGMHRSGTSALTRCLNLLGVDLGSHLLSPEKANAKGFWEHADAVRINDALLQSFDMDWHSLDPLPADWLDSEGAANARDEIRALFRRDFQGVPLWGLKDPRMCRTAPLWIQTLQELNVDIACVFVVRSPLEVAASLQRAHGLSISSSVLSWLQHLAESEIATRDVVRTMVDYDRLLEAPFELLDNISRALELAWPISMETRKGAIQSFLDADLRTHRKRATDREVPPIVHRALEACARIIAGDDRSGWSDLSRVADEAVDMLLVLASQQESGVEAAAADAPKGIRTLEKQIQKRDAEIKQLKSTLDALVSTMREFVTRQEFNAALPAESGGGDRAKIYFRRTDEEYSESKGISVAHDGLREVTSLRFELPSDESFDFIRFDPSEFPGEFHVTQLRLRDTEVDGLNRALVHCNGRLITVGAGELQFISVDSDPNIELDLRRIAEGPWPGLTIEMHCRRITLRKVLEKSMERAFVDANGVEQVNAKLEVQGRQLQQLVDARKEMDGRLAQLFEQMEQLHALQRRTLLDRLLNRVAKAK